MRRGQKAEGYGARDLNINLIRVYRRSSVGVSQLS